MLDSVSCSIKYGSQKIDYELFYADRKTLEIAVHPNKTIVVKAPSNSSIQTIEAKVKKRARWIKRQVRYFQQFDPRTPAKSYVGGETHLYLGKKYRLKIISSRRNSVSLKKGYFYVETTKDCSEQIKSNMDRWYKERAQHHLKALFDNCWEDFKNENVEKPKLSIKAMKKRWGSLSKNKTLSLNTELIKTPKECIEYVLFHEFCHLIEHNHGPDFYRLLDKTLPDWLKRKHKLEMSLI